MYNKQGFIARDRNGNLYIYDKLPKRDRTNGIWQVNEKFDKFYQLPNDWFPEITWDDEPRKVEISIKLL